MKSVTYFLLVTFLFHSVSFGSDLRSGSRHRPRHSENGSATKMYAALEKSIDDGIANQDYSGPKGEANFLSDTKNAQTEMFAYLDRISEVQAKELLSKSKIKNNSPFISDKEFVISQIKMESAEKFEKLKLELRGFKSVKSFLKDKKQKFSTKGAGEVIGGIAGWSLGILFFWAIFTGAWGTAGLAFLGIGIFLGVALENGW